MFFIAFAAGDGAGVGAPSGAHGFLVLSWRTFFTATCICNEKSSERGAGVTDFGRQVSAAMPPNAFGALKLRNQYSFLASVSHGLANGAISAATGYCAVPWQLRHPEIGLSTGPLARPAQPRCAAA